MRFLMLKTQGLRSKARVLHRARGVEGGQSKGAARVVGVDRVVGVAEGMVEEGVPFGDAVARLDLQSRPIHRRWAVRPLLRPGRPRHRTVGG